MLALKEKGLGPKANRALLCFLDRYDPYTMPCAIIASATFSKPAMFAPTT